MRYVHALCAESNAVTVLRVGELGLALLGERRHALLAIGLKHCIEYKECHRREYCVNTVAKDAWNRRFSYCRPSVKLSSYAGGKMGQIKREEGL